MKVTEGIGQITFTSVPQLNAFATTASTSSCHQQLSATFTFDSDRGSVVGAIGDTHSVENCGPGKDLFVKFDLFVHKVRRGAIVELLQITYILI